MNKIFIFLLCSLLCSCYLHRNNCYNYDDAQKETVIKLYAKIIPRGTLRFLRYENGFYRIMDYSYLVDKKSKTSRCTLYRDTLLYSADDLLKIDDGKSWMTSSTFKQFFAPPLYDPYLCCFSDDFLDLSNDDKIKVLDSISKR